MKNRIVCVIKTCLLIFSFLYLWACTGTTVPDTVSETDRPDKGFLVASIDYSIMDRWYRTLSETAPQIKETGTVVKGQYFNILLFFLDYGKDGADNVRLTYDLEIIAPDGKIYIIQKDIQGIDRKISAPKNVLMAGGIMKVCFEPEDKPGKYKIKASVRDHVRQESYTLETDILLTE